MSKWMPLGLCLMMLCACSTVQKSGEMRQYLCADGTAFSLEVAETWVRLHTATGEVELRRESADGQVLYTNGLRSIILEADGSTRHAVGRRAWTTCTFD